MARWLLGVAIIGLVLASVTLCTLPAEAATCGGGLDEELEVGCGGQGGGPNGGPNGPSGPTTASRYYWISFEYPGADPLSRLCALPNGDAGITHWERLMDRETGLEVMVRSRCLPINAPEPEPTPDPPSPAEIWDAVPVPEPSVSVNPAGKGVTGLETWLWLEGVTNLDVGPLTLDGWSVTATATVERIVWDMGDGHSASSTKRGSEANPAATYTYERKSGAEPYTLTVVAHWHGTATITGFGTTLTQDLGTVTTNGSRPYDIDEVRSVLVE